MRPHRERHRGLAHRRRRRGGARLRRGRCDRHGSVDRPGEPGDLPDALRTSSRTRCSARIARLPRRVGRRRPGGRPGHQGAFEGGAGGDHRAAGARIDRADGRRRPIPGRWRSASRTGVRRRPSDRCGPDSDSRRRATRRGASPSPRRVPPRGRPGSPRTSRSSSRRPGKRVLLIDADLRKPKVADAFGIIGAVGLTTVLIDAIPLPSAVQPWPRRRLEILPRGRCRRTPRNSWRRSG